MASNTQYSSQTVVNRLYGSGDTQYSVQEVFNGQYGTLATLYSPQVIMNRNLGVSDDAYSEQQALFRTLASELTLTGSDTQYSVQELLNMAYTAGVTLGYIIGTYSSVGLGTGGLLLLMAEA